MAYDINATETPEDAQRAFQRERDRIAADGYNPDDQFGEKQLTPEEAQAQADHNNAQKNDPIAYSNANAWALGGGRAEQDQMFQTLGQGWGSAQGRQGVQANGQQFTADRWQEMAARQAQQAAMAQWQNAAAGNGPSAAAAQYQNAALGAMGQQAGAMAGARPGMGMAGATRAAMFGGAQSMGAAAQQGASTRAQEMQVAMGGYSNASQAMRGQDIGRAGQSQQWAMDQARLQDAQRARNDAMEQFYAGQYMGNQQQVSSRQSSNVWAQAQLNAEAARLAREQSNQAANKFWATAGAVGKGASRLVGG